MIERNLAAQTLEQEPEIARSSLDFPVVGIGASAGGLEALSRLLESVPDESGMAFVIILHLSPRHPSNLAEILQRSTAMPVAQVNETVSILPNHVYVIPPNKQLLMTDDHLELSDGERPMGRHISIDLFFRTLAEAHRSRAVSIVLSGTGTDGCIGLSKVKEQGGITIAQLPEDAAFDGMPKSAIATRQIDFVLPAAAIGQKLAELWENIRTIQLPETAVSEHDEAPPASPINAQTYEEALRDVMSIMRVRTGHDFRHYKRATILRRIERRLQVNGLADMVSYSGYLRGNPRETGALLSDLLISVTNFFRDRDAFDALDREVIAKLFNDRPADAQIRVWIPSCATGEEAYSVAMLLCERADPMASPQALLIFATDIDERAIAAGRAGLFPDAIVADVSPQRLQQFFTIDDGQFLVKKSVREKVLFASHNILRDPPFSRLDLISCRNLLIYLDRTVQEEILRMFHFALRPGGYLFLGASESADVVGELFSVIDKKHRIYQAKTVARGSRQIPTMPLGAYEKRMPQTTEARSDSPPTPYAELHQRLLQQCAPPSVLINHEYGIVHLSDEVGRFLRHSGGPPSHNLLSVLRPELRLELRTALFQAAQTGHSVEARRVELSQDGHHYSVHMTVRPASDSSAPSDLFLVLFKEVEDTIGGDGHVPADNGQAEIVRQLEEELKRSKEQQQSFIEQAETSNEEMKASNEELQAINEELRSASEELETSKEELQSINEELITVNYELKVKVEETDKVNDDLQNLIASTDIATIFIDGQMGIMRYTPRALDLFSLIPSDVGRSLLDITHRMDYDQLTDDAKQVFETLRPIEREVRSTDHRSYIARLSPYRTTDHRIQGAVLTLVEITRLRRAEEEVSAGVARMRLIAECTEDYIIITMDTEARITSWNKGAEAAFGYREHEIKGLPFAQLFTEQDRELGVPEGELLRARADGRAHDERWLRRNDGSQFYASGVTMVLEDHGSEGLLGYSNITRDLTVSKRLEVEREALLDSERSLRAEAEKSSQVKDEFLAIMSHELKHPLNLININADLLARIPEAGSVPNIRRATAAIRSAVSSQAQVIDDMLDLSRVNTGNLQLSRTPIVWNDVIENILGAFEEDVRKNRIDLQYLPGDGELVIDADLVRVEQIVWNLLSNAIKFTPEGGTIRVTLARAGALARMEVIDNGQGITADLVANVFELFQRGTSRTRRQEDGLGIGLALVRQLSVLHGGHATAYSEGEGRGSCFTVFLPLAEKGALPEFTQTSADAGGLSGRRVLVVDDTEDTLLVLGELLTILGAETVTTTSGQGALEQLRSGKFDVLLSDIGMPGMDGYQLIREVRKSAGNANIAAIALSGYGRESDVRQALSAGFNAHLSKPFSFERLLSSVESVLQAPPADDKASH